MDKTTEQKAEAIARRIARERGVPVSLWELFLVDAYHELFPIQETPPSVSHG